MRNKQMKRLQKEAVGYINKINKDIANDDIWLGRFVARQINAHWCWDGSMLVSYIRFVDKKSNYYKDYRIDFFLDFPLNYGHLWEAANDFIVNKVDVWCGYKGPKPYDPDFRVDYINVKVPEKVWNERPYNWYIDYKNWKGNSNE